MKEFIVITGTVIIGAMIYVVIVLKWFFKLQHNNFTRTVHVVERVYKPMDFIQRFQYTEDTFNYSHSHLPLTLNSDHKKLMIKDMAYNLSLDMLEAGVFNITEIDQYYCPGKIIEMRIKVYKPD